MERKCFKDQCSKKIAFACSSEESYLYSCKVHIAEFMTHYKDYRISSILIDIPPNEIPKTLNKVQEILEFLVTLRNKNYQLTANLISNVMNQYRIFESKIFLTIKEITKMSIRIKKNKNIDSELFSWVSDIDRDFMKKTLHSNSKDYEIGNIYNNDILNISEKDCDYIFFIRKSTKEIQIIDINNLSATFPEFLKGKTIGSGASLCLLKKKLFFYFGGYASLRRIGSAYIIDLKKNTCVDLESQSPASGSGAVLKNDIVYIFGGYVWNNHLATCTSYNLKKQIWAPIKSLPLGISACTATLNFNKIVLTGNCAPYLYHFNEEEELFWEIIQLPLEGFKYTTENYIIFNDNLLIDEDYNFNYKYYRNIGFTIGNISPYCFFRRKNFIYFIEYEGKLYRINCQEKKIEYVININT